MIIYIRRDVCTVGTNILRKICNGKSTLYKAFLCNPFLKTVVDNIILRLWQQDGRRIIDSFFTYLFYFVIEQIIILICYISIYVEWNCRNYPKVYILVGNKREQPLSNTKYYCPIRKYRHPANISIDIIRMVTVKHTLQTMHCHKQATGKEYTIQNKYCRHYYESNKAGSTVWC